jgi:hypothetical protein
VTQPLLVFVALQLSGLVFALALTRWKVDKPQWCEGVRVAGDEPPITCPVCGANVYAAYRDGETPEKDPIYRLVGHKPGPSFRGVR